MDPMFVCRGYGRASIERQVISPLQQEETCYQAFQLFKRVKPGWSNAVWGGFYTEEPMTRTSKFRERPIGSLVLTVTQKGDAIIASNYDRMFANVMDVCEVIEDVERRQFRIVILDLDLPIDNNLGQAVFKLLEVIKELEVKEIRRRMRESKRYRLDHGLPVGQPPVGWKNVVFRSRKNAGLLKRHVIDYEQRKIGAIAANLKLAGLSIQKIMEHFRDHNIPAPDKRGWTYLRIRRLTKFSLLGFPLPNGSHEAPPIPEDVDAVMMVGPKD